VSESGLETNAPSREQMKSAEPDYLTALQVADLLQVDEKTVLRCRYRTPRCRSCAAAVLYASRASGSRPGSSGRNRAARGGQRRRKSPAA
jgi:hypothetical protein